MFLSYIIETVGDRGLGMVSKALKLNFMIEMGPLEAWKLGFWTVGGSFLTILKRVLSFLSYILETVGDRGLGLVLKVLKLNFI